MRLHRLLVPAACLAAGLLSLSPAWSQVFKCTGPDGRVEYASTPCDKGQRQQLQIRGGGAAPPTASSKAPAAGLPGAAEPLSPRRRDAYFNAVRCERARHELGVLRAEMTAFNAEKVNGLGLVSVREQAVKQMLASTELLVARDCSGPAGWVTEADGIRPQNCQGLFDEFKRLVVGSTKSNGLGREAVNAAQERLSYMNCGAPR